MVDLLFADIDVAAKAGRYVIYVLAVFGGFLVGNVVTLVLCRLLAKAMFKRRMPEQLERALRVIGGIIVAALVAFLLFRMGPGWGLGGSGTGEGEGSGGPTSKESNTSGSKDAKDSKSTELESVVSPVIQVRIGKASDYPRTFWFKGDHEGIDLAAAKKRLDELARTVKREPILELRIYQNSTEAGHPEVRELIDHAHSLRFSTRVEKIADRLP
jgi:hypothetical protein